MKKILKFKLKHHGLNRVDLPIGYDLLCFQTQRDEICLWVQGDPDGDTTRVNYLVLGTGEELPTNVSLHYLNTVQQANGMLVWHIFYVND